MKTDFPVIFERLCKILRKYSQSLTVTADSPSLYCVALEYSPRFKKGFPVAWVKIGKRYVSYHFMPVYMSPALKKSLSKKLQARMQGKSCFNFKATDDPLFHEVEDLTARGFKECRKTGIFPAT